MSGRSPEAAVKAEIAGDKSGSGVNSTPWPVIHSRVAEMAARNSSPVTHPSAIANACSGPVEMFAIRIIAASSFVHDPDGLCWRTKD